MGVPSVKASAIPMTKLLPNVLDLPFVSSLVQSAIAAAAYTYVAPRSMTLNIMQILSGDGELPASRYSFITDGLQALRRTPRHSAYWRSRSTMPSTSPRKTRTDSPTPTSSRRSKSSANRSIRRESSLALSAPSGRRPSFSLSLPTRSKRPSVSRSSFGTRTGSRRTTSSGGSRSHSSTSWR